MGAMMICARIFFEQEDSKKSLFISLAVILVLNPYAIFDISMQLSYMAVAAIIFVYPPVEKLCEIKFLGNMKTGLVKDTVKLMLLSLTIQITSIPLFLYYFDKLPLFSFLLNIVGVPLGTILIEVLFFITLCNILYLKILNILFIPLAKIIYNGFEGFIFLGNKVPFLQVDINGKVDIWSVIIYYVILYVIILYMNKSYNIMAEKKKVQEKKKIKLQREIG
jgi:ComEC/Rec2-like protein